MIYHITSRAEWQAAQQHGHYTAPSLQDQGFIHLSATVEQVERVADALYAGQTGLVVLVVNPHKLKADLRYEPPDTTIHAEHYDGELFPHLYGPLELEAVTKAVDLVQDADGRWLFDDHAN